jgi:hypothetical protein
MSQVLGMLGLLDFTMLQPVLASRARLETYELFISLIPQFFFSGRSRLRLTETAAADQWIQGHTCM